MAHKISGSAVFSNTNSFSAERVGSSTPPCRNCTRTSIASSCNSREQSQKTAIEFCQKAVADYYIFLAQVNPIAIGGDWSVPDGSGDTAGPLLSSDIDKMRFEIKGVVRMMWLNHTATRINRRILGTVKKRWHSDIVNAFAKTNIKNIAWASQINFDVISGDRLSGFLRERCGDEIDYSPIANNGFYLIACLKNRGLMHNIFFDVLKSNDNILLNDTVKSYKFAPPAITAAEIAFPYNPPKIAEIKVDFGLERTVVGVSEDIIKEIRKRSGNLSNTLYNGEASFIGSFFTTKGKDGKPKKTDSPLALPTRIKVFINGEYQNMIGVKATNIRGMFRNAFFHLHDETRTNNLFGYVCGNTRQESKIEQTFFQYGEERDTLLLQSLTGQKYAYTNHRFNVNKDDNKWMHIHAGHLPLDGDDHASLVLRIYNPTLEDVSGIIKTLYYIKAGFWATGRAKSRGFGRVLLGNDVSVKWITDVKDYLLGNAGAIREKIYKFKASKAAAGKPAASSPLPSSGKVVQKSSSSQNYTVPPSPLENKKEIETWESAHISWNSGGGGVLSAIYPADVKKKASGNKKELVPEPLHKKVFQKKEAVKAKVTVEKIGNAYIIVSVAQNA